MFATTPNAGSATLVAINGMLPATPGGTQLTPNPGAFFAMPSNLSSPNFMTNSNLPGGSFFLPSTFSPGLSCTATPFSSPQFQPHMLPFFSPTPGAMLSTNSPIPLTSPFTTPLPQFLQPQVSGTSLNGYTSNLPATSVVPPLSAQPSVFTDPSSGGTNTVCSTVYAGQLPSTSMVFSSVPLSLNTSSTNNASDAPTFPMTAPGSAIVTTNTNLTAVSSLPITTTYANSTVPAVSSALVYSTTAGSASNSTELQSSPGTCSSHITPNLQSSFKIDKAPPVIPGNSAVRSSNNLLQLESVDFHRDEILDAIDKLRERKARPDFERISCMLKRYRNINPDQTQICLGRLAAAGAVVCVDYKGNLSYRNPSKWRKTATRAGITNLPSVSARLLDAVRRLMAGTVNQSHNGIDQASSLLSTAPGPNGGYSLFQIERALQTETSNVESSNSQIPRKLSGLTGATLRVCLDREATLGKLAKTPDGRYILDESGERKRLANISVAPPTHLLNKKPLPPNGSTFVSPGSTKYGKPPNSMAPIAPAGDPAARLIIARQSAGAISIAPPVGGTVNPLLGLSTRPGATRRGRPPGSKSRKCTSQTEITTSSEKKIKLEAPTTSTPEGSNHISASSMLSPPSAPVFTVAKPCPTPPVLSVNQNGFCNVATSLNLPPSFVTGLTQSTICSTVLPNPIFSTAFPNSHPSDIPLPHTFGSQFLTFSTCPPASYSGPLPQTFMPTLPSGLPCDFTTLPRQPSPSNSPAIPPLSDSGSGQSQYNPDEKLENEGFCCHCGAPQTKEEIFLICKDCGLRAHPTCLDYWPELTERARQSPWQCTDCKTCTVCQNKQITSDLLVCDACDKGFHIECHVPKLEEPVDRSLPWVCADCQKEGYSVAIGTLPGESDEKFEDSITTALVEQGSKEQQIEDGSRCSHDEHETNDETELSKTENNNSSKLEDVTEDKESIPKGEAGGSTVGTSPGNSESTQPVESNRLATPDSTVQNASSPVSETPVSWQHTPQGRCSSTDEQRGTPRTRRDSSSSDKSRTPDRGTGFRLESNLIPLEQSPQAVHSDYCAPRDSVAKDTQDAEGLEQNFSQDTVQYRPPDIRTWSVDHVREWLLEEGFPREAEAFCQQEIDGACLLLMKRMDVLTELGIKLGPAVKIYERIKRLQSGCSSPTLLNT